MKRVCCKYYKGIIGKAINLPWEWHFCQRKAPFPQTMSSHVFFAYVFGAEFDVAVKKTSE